MAVEQNGSKHNKFYLTEDGFISVAEQIILGCWGLLRVQCDYIYERNLKQMAVVVAL
jgi:hypothetical protein